jgi:hypothetical protein
MTLRLICAIPDPGNAGSPRGLFYDNTPEGHAHAKEFARAQDRPGWGVFECVSTFREPTMEAFDEVLKLNGWRR